MICYKEQYGEDIDGNRGTTIIVAEREPGDSEQIREQIIAQFDPDIEEYTVFLICPQFETEHEFDVLIFDYFTEAEITAMTEEN